MHDDRLRRLFPATAGALVIAVAGCSAVTDWFGSPCRGGLDPNTDYLQVVRAYADGMIRDARDEYGDVHSPLFAVTLDRRTSALPKGLRLRSIRRLGFEDWGIRPADRVLSGANPMRHQNLYQTLYALTVTTGEASYAQEADEALRWFFQHAQSPGTGLMAWGDHAGWHFHRNEREGRDIHEFSRPWLLWDRTFELAPAAAERFAYGLWDHQIADQETGAFSRHARLSEHGPASGSEFPRHAGFFIDVWTRAYDRTDDPRFLEAIETLLDHYSRHASPITGAIPAEIGNPRSDDVMLWPQSNLSFAIDLWRAAESGHLPPGLERRMRDMATGIDEVYHRLPHKVHEAQGGFVQRSHIHTLEAVSVIPGYSDPYTDLWGGAYGHNSTVRIANIVLLRYHQTGAQGYRRLVVDAATQYLDSDPDAEAVVYPGTLGDAIFLMLGAHEITEDQRFLDRADHFGRLALTLFFDDESPFPCATSQHGHYESNINRPDTLVMALLRLWQVLNQPDLELRLIWNDR